MSGMDRGIRVGKGFAPGEEASAAPEGEQAAAQGPPERKGAWKHC
jgi:hypothetical protein